MTAAPASPLEAALDAIRNDAALTEDDIEAKAASIAALVDTSAPQWALLFPGEPSGLGRKYAYKAAGGKFVFNNPHKTITADELRLARARYLVTCQHEIGNAIRKRFPKR